MDFSKDISKETARRAFYWTSQFPDKRGDRVVSDYNSSMASYYQQIVGNAIPEEKEKAEEFFDSFRAGYKKRFNDWLHSNSRVASSFITGPANFPVERNRKRSDAADNKFRELLAYENKMLSKGRMFSIPEHLRPIKTGSSGALEKLQKKLDSLQRNQDFMKRVNAIYKKYQKDPDYLKNNDVENSVVEAIKAHENRPERLNYIKRPFPSYSLQNNNQNMARIKGRIETEKKLAAAGSEGNKNFEFDGGKVVYNYDINRIQISHDEIPPQEVRDKLKKYGFRWSRKAKAWQRHLHTTTDWKVKDIVGEMKQVEAPKNKEVDMSIPGAAKAIKDAIDVEIQNENKAAVPPKAIDYGKKVSADFRELEPGKEKYIGEWFISYDNGRTTIAQLVRFKELDGEIWLGLHSAANEFSMSLERTVGSPVPYRKLSQRSGDMISFILGGREYTSDVLKVRESGYEVDVFGYKIIPFSDVIKINGIDAVSVEFDVVSAPFESNNPGLPDRKGTKYFDFDQKQYEITGTKKIKDVEYYTSKEVSAKNPMERLEDLESMEKILESQEQIKKDIEAREKRETEASEKLANEKQVKERLEKALKPYARTIMELGRWVSELTKKKTISGKTDFLFKLVEEFAKGSKNPEVRDIKGKPHYSNDGSTYTPLVYRSAEVYFKHLTKMDQGRSVEQVSHTLFDDDAMEEMKKSGVVEAVVNKESQAKKKATGRQFNKSERKLAKQKIAAIVVKEAKGKNELTPKQVIAIAKQINANRSLYSQFIDAGADHKILRLPTEQNLRVWAKNPGKSDLLGVDSNKAKQPTLKRDKDFIKAAFDSLDDFLDSLFK